MTTIRIDHRGPLARLVQRGPAFLLSLLLGLALTLYNHESLLGGAPGETAACGGWNLAGWAVRGDAPAPGHFISLTAPGRNAAS